MTNPTIRIIDGDTITDREMTDAEHALLKDNQVTELARIDAQTVRQVARQAVLDRLGITAAEATLLVG